MLNILKVKGLLHYSIIIFAICHICDSSLQLLEHWLSDTLVPTFEMCWFVLLVWKCMYIFTSLQPDQQLYVLFYWSNNNAHDTFHLVKSSLHIQACDKLYYCAKLLAPCVFIFSFIFWLPKSSDFYLTIFPGMFLYLFVKPLNMNLWIIKMNSTRGINHFYVYTWYAIN